MAKKTAAGDQGRKTDSLSLRLDPATKWGLELMSRAQRRPITGVVEWIISEAFKRERIEIRPDSFENVQNLISDTYGTHELERLLGLWEKAPDLLNYDERRLVQVLCNTEPMWKGPIQYYAFKWGAVIDVWERLRPVAVEAAEKNPRAGLSEQQLASVLFDPFDLN